MATPYYGRPSIIRMVHESPPQLQTGPLFRIPVELRELIYSHLLNPARGRDPPRGQGMQPNVLQTCKQIANEASTCLYSTQHEIRYSSTLEPHWRIINATSLRFLQDLFIRMEFSTLSRGECDIAVQHAQRVIDFTEGIMLTLQHSKALQSLHIELCNLNQRKVGKRRLRSDECMEQMGHILRPFAALPVSQKVTVGGFDTIAFVDMFDDMRRSKASKEFVFDLDRGEVRYGIS